MDQVSSKPSLLSSANPYVGQYRVRSRVLSNESNELIVLTADIVSAHVSNNEVDTRQLSGLIETVYSALSGLGTGSVVAEQPAPKLKPAVSVKASIKPDHLISMIDGKPYKMLRRHLRRHGYTPESYRQAFGLPHDYPIVAPNYAETRRALAHKIGLGKRER